MQSINNSCYSLARHGRYKTGKAIRRTSNKFIEIYSKRFKNIVTTCNICETDVVVFGNYCIDVLCEVNTLPGGDGTLSYEEQSKLLNYLQKEFAQPSNWEVGGNGNFTIASSRLGLITDCVGHDTHDQYSEWYKTIIQSEGVHAMHPTFPPPIPASRNHFLMCYVLVNPRKEHVFCSTYHKEWLPWFKDNHVLSDSASSALTRTRAMWVNGFIFDDLQPELIMKAIGMAQSQGVTVFFDPGPRSSLVNDPKNQQRLLNMIKACNVLVLTQDEACVLIGQTHLSPTQTLTHIRALCGPSIRWIVIKQGSRGALVHCTWSGLSAYSRGFAVQVADTVGCGDSFGAAIVHGYLQYVETFFGGGGLEECARQVCESGIWESKS